MTFRFFIHSPEVGHLDRKKFRENSSRFCLCCYVIIIHTVGFGFRYYNKNSKIKITVPQGMQENKLLYHESSFLKIRTMLFFYCVEQIPIFFDLSFFASKVMTSGDQPQRIRVTPLKTQLTCKTR